MKSKKKLYISILSCLVVILLIGFITFMNKTFSAGTIYYDWSSINKITEDYSYSTLFRSPSTQVKVIKDAGKNSSTGSLFYRDSLTPGSELIVLITNCATNKNGELLDVVVKINNVKKFSGSSSGSVSVTIGDSYEIANSQNNPASYTTYSQQVNAPLVFGFDADTAQADFTMTYYKAGTYVSESQKGVLGEINSVSGIYWDFDVHNWSDSYEGNLFNGDEGVKPIVGNSIIYYNKNGKHSSNDYNHTLKEQSDGIAINKRHNKNTNTIYYESAAFITTNNIPNSTFSFTYSGAGCGIQYMFASPYPFEIDSPMKSADKADVETGGNFIYTVSQYIPNNYYGTLFSFHEIYSQLYKTSRFSNVVIKDTLDSHLTINQGNIKVLNENNADVTSYFNIEVAGNTVTATANAGMLNNVNFYAHTYKLQIPVTVKSDTYGIDKVTNKATTTSTICRNDNDCPTENKDTNESDVKIKYKLTVNYIEDGTSNKVAVTDEGYKYFNDAYTTNYDKVDLKVWLFVRSGGDAVNGNITKDTTVNYYFVRRPYTLTVNYLEEGTNKPIDMPADITNPLYYDSQYSTNYNKVNSLKWKIIRSEVQKGSGTTAEDKTISGQIKEDTIINYYFEKIPYGLTVNYYEEGTNNVIADADITRPVYYDDAYETNHDKIEHRMWRIVRSEVAEGEGEVNNQENKTISGIIRGNTVINYYFEKIEYPVTVNYYDAQTKEKIEESDKTIYYFDMKYYTNYDKVDRDIWEYVSTDGDEIEGVITGEQESYTINYYFNRLKYRLKVNYYDDKTKKKIETSDKYAYNYEDEYTTNYDKVDTEYWEYVRTEGETPGRIYEDTEVDYYFKNNEYTIEVNYYDEETGEKIDDPEISSHKYDEEYKTNDDKIDKKKWELVEVPENAEGRVDGDIEVNYYYRRRKYKIIVNYYEEGTENKIAESRESEANYGDKYITDYNNVDGKVWELVGMPDNYQGEIKEDTIVNYYFKQVEIKNPQTGTNQNNITKTIIPSIVLITIIFITGLIYRIHLKKKIYKI